MGYSPALPSLSGIGYKQICQYRAGDLDLGTAVARIKMATHRLARQQYTWFRLDDRRIRWLEGDGAVAEALALAERFLEKSARTAAR
jgi:tRNA dimethylallyltransferase